MNENIWVESTNDVIGAQIEKIPHFMGKMVVCYNEEGAPLARHHMSRCMGVNYVYGILMMGE